MSAVGWGERSEPQHAACAFSVRGQIIVPAKKPLGLVATVIYCAFWGCLFLAAGFLFLLGCCASEGGGLYSLFSVFGVFLLAAAYGLWSLRAWGKTLAVWLTVASILHGIVGFFLLGQELTVADTALQLLEIGVNIVIIRYLRQEKVAALFASAR